MLNAAKKAALSVVKTVRVDVDSLLKDLPPLKDPPPTHIDNNGRWFHRWPWGFLSGP